MVASKKSISKEVLLCLVASSMAAIEILKYLNDDVNSLKSLNKRIGLSNIDFTMLKLDVNRNVNCEYCGQNIKA